MITTTQPRWLAPGDDDATLLRAACDGDADAFQVLFRRHVEAIHAFLRLRVGPDAADDLVVTAFATAWERRATFRADSDSARPWLYGIATMLVHRHRADEQRWQASVAAQRELFSSGSMEPITEVGAFDPALVRAIAQLAPSERDVFLLSALGELTPAECARALEITTIAARVRLHRARTRLQRLLNDGAN